VVMLDYRIRKKDNQSLLTGTFCCGFFLRLTPFAARFLPLVARLSPFAMGGEMDGLLDMFCEVLCGSFQNADQFK